MHAGIRTHAYITHIRSHTRIHAGSAHAGGPPGHEQHAVHGLRRQGERLVHTGTPGRWNRGPTRNYCLCSLPTLSSSPTVSTPPLHSCLIVYWLLAAGCQIINVCWGLAAPDCWLLSAFYCLFPGCGYDSLGSRVHSNSTHTELIIPDQC
jgi:hypothetical protein